MTEAKFTTESSAIHDDVVVDGDEMRDEVFQCTREIKGLVRETYGPAGRAKLLVDHAGEKHVSTSSAVILDAVEITHPVGRLFVEAFGRERVYEGATFGTLLATGLLSEAESLLERGITPPTVVRGFETALQRARVALEDLATDVSIDPESDYMLAKTAIGQTDTGETDDHLLHVVVDTVQTLDSDVTVSDVHFEEDIRLTVDASRVVAGTLVRKNPVADPGTQDDASILLVDSGFVERPLADVPEDVTISGPESFETATAETAAIDEWVRPTVETGADAVVCKGPIPSGVAGPLEQQGLLLVENVEDDDFQRIRAAVGGESVSPREIGAASLGTAGKLSVTDHGAGTKQSIIFGDCEQPDTATVIVNGGTGSVTDFAKQRIAEGIEAVGAAHADPRVVPGAGATEMEIAKRVRDVECGRREQLAVDAFADAIEQLPLVLAENSGFDPLAMRSDLRAAHRSSPDQGIDLEGGSTFDALSGGIVEPRSLKIERMTAAVELAVALLRLDGKISASG